MNTPVIKPNATRGAGSTAILGHLASIWPRTAHRAELSAVFVKADGRATATQPLAKRVDMSLSAMVKSGVISCRGTGPDREWLLGPAVKLTEPPKPGKAESEAELPAYVGVCVPARQYEVMGSSVYQPKQMQALRAGSDDFTRLPSLRQGGQRLPFTGGYVVMAGSKA